MMLPTVTGARFPHRKLRQVRPGTSGNASVDSTNSPYGMKYTAYLAWDQFELRPLGELRLHTSLGAKRLLRESAHQLSRSSCPNSQASSSASADADRRPRAGTDAHSGELAALDQPIHAPDAPRAASPPPRALSATFADSPAYSGLPAVYPRARMAPAWPRRGPWESSRRPPRPDRSVGRAEAARPQTDSCGLRIQSQNCSTVKIPSRAEGFERCTLSAPDEVLLIVGDEHVAPLAAVGLEIIASRKRCAASR